MATSAALLRVKGRCQKKQEKHIGGAILRLYGWLFRIVKFNAFIEESGIWSEGIAGTTREEMHKNKRSITCLGAQCRCARDYHRGALPKHSITCKYSICMIRARMSASKHTSKTIPHAICGCILALETTSLIVAPFKFRPYVHLS